MIMGLENSGIKLTLDYVKNILLLEVNDKNSETALISKQKFVRNQRKQKKDGKCYLCKQIGHIMKDCPKKDKDAASNKKKSDTVLLSSSAFLVNKKSIDSDWFFDSAATLNMTKNESWLQNKRISDKSEIITANNGSMPIECVGDVKENVLVNEREKSVTIKNVQYVPDIVANLLSVGQIVQNDNVVIFRKSGCEVYDPSNKVIATGSFINNSLYLTKLSHQILYLKTISRVLILQRKKKT